MENGEAPQTHVVLACQTQMKTFEMKGKLSVWHTCLCFSRVVVMKNVKFKTVLLLCLYFLRLDEEKETAKIKFCPYQIQNKILSLSVDA